MPATGLPGSVLYIVMPIAGVIIVIESLMDLFQVHSSLENFDTLMGKGEEDA
jgi:TRAP-type C4-dicarboxylate transport system permease small subunit